METLKEFFKNVNYRLSSPFIFSFVVSWLICNWQIPTALFIYNNETLKAEGSLHYIALVSKYLNWCHGLLLPFAGALFYTFAYPYINKWIKDYQTKAEVKAEASELEIRKGSSIPMDKYLTLRESLISKEQNLVEIIAQESSTRDQLTVAQDHLHSAQIRNAELVDEANKARAEILDYNNLKKEYVLLDSIADFFKGTWVCEYSIPSSNNRTKDTIGFEPFYINNADYHEKGVARFNIQYIRFVSFLSTLTFHKKSLTERDSIRVVTLTKINEELWNGTEKFSNGTIAFVRYYPKDKLPVFYQFVLSEANMDSVSGINEMRTIIMNGINTFKK